MTHGPMARAARTSIQLGQNVSIQLAVNIFVNARAARTSVKFHFPFAPGNALRFEEVKTCICRMAI